MAYKQQPDNNTLLSPSQVAQRFGVPVGRVYQALNDGRLVGEKVGWGIVLREKDLPKKWPGRRGS